MLISDSMDAYNGWNNEDVELYEQANLISLIGGEWNHMRLLLSR